MPLYRRVEKNAQLLEFKCVEFVEDLIYGHLRKVPAQNTEVSNEPSISRGNRRARPWRSRSAVALLTPRVPPVSTVCSGPAADTPPPAAGSKAMDACPRRRTASPTCRGIWTNTTYTPLERPNGVTKEFYTPEGSSSSVIKKAAAARERADRAGHGRGRALRLHAVRAGQEPVARSTHEPAHVADRRPAERQASPVDGGGTEAGRRLRGGATQAHGRSVPTQVQNMPIGIALHHHGAPGRRCCRRATTTTIRSSRARAT